MNIPLKKVLPLLIIPMFLTLIVESSEAKNINVSQNGSVTTIEEALKLAHNGDRIIVDKGVYVGNQINVNKQVTIIGRKGAILDGMGKYQIMVVTADSVTIENLTFRNAGISYVNDNAAIKLKEVRDCIIKHNKLINNFFGIYLAKSKYCTISQDSVIGNGREETASGGGIHLWNCDHITITHNYTSKNRDGIYFEFVNHTTITHNVSENNIRYGLHLMYSRHDSYTYNLFKDNHAGGVVMYCKFITVKHNVFQHNWGPSEDGLLLKELNDGVVEDNRFYQNSTAVYSEGSNRVMIDHNNFIRNGWAVKIMSNSTQNDFVNNNFIENAFDVVTSGRVNDNEFNHNYWTAYKGYDLNKDGIGDVPYHPVSLFSYIVNQQSPAMILMHSIFIQVLDVAEKALPVLTPKTLVDHDPLMNRVVVSI